MPEDIRIRTANAGDVPALLAIYAPYVRETAITFEYDVPSETEFARRMEETLHHYPYLVAEEMRSGDPGRILGYAYAGPFHVRPAYDWAVETSIYVDRDRKHGGVGRILHDALQDTLQKMGILNMNACIAVPAGEGADPRLDRNSERFHAHMGYRLVGEFTKCGYKFGTWYDMVWMEKLIGAHLPEQPPVIPFPGLPC